MNVVICGAGVIGAATAYYLSLRGIGATVVERCDVACAASGKSGGFLALDWCDGTPLEDLARKSFALHADLAESLQADYGYRRLETFQLAASRDSNVNRYRRLESPSWLDGNCAIYSKLGSKATTAQVHPERFTRALLDAAIAKGATLKRGEITGIELGSSGTKVTSVRVGDDILPADATVIAMGPWSVLATAWLPMPLVGGLKSHSILIRTSEPIPGQALFVEFVLDSGDPRAPEIIPRVDGDVYVCGISDEQPLPADPSKVAVRDAACNELRAMAGVLSTALGRGQVVRRQACYRPICEDALPIIGKVPGVTGAYVATGHNCWGILNAPASGLAMAQLIAEGKANVVDLTPFNLERLPRAPSGAASMKGSSS
ncbi:MAG: FAD-binding oxidoreductase [Gammaproteobacteria bacterium]|nr:FAD-binding oxidoreductase [Gammaproteobacteria bacterium]MDH3411828.1 FAD-binding oxidoreductase [Gammaproteobacteria bacterium]